MAVWTCRQIDCFLAVATDLHFGKAAERLALAQSSVSEAIRSLEHEVGGPLFVRTSRRVQLTPLGEKLRRGVEPAALVLRATLDGCDSASSRRRWCFAPRWT